MPDTPNYNETTVAGTSWVRAYKIEINNPYGGTPYLYINEEKLYNMENERFVQPVGNLTVSFDAENPKHLQIYSLLNEIYVEERAKRDNPITP